MLTGRLAEVESIKENVTAEAEELRARLAGVNTVLTELQSTGSVGVSESNNSIGSILRTTIAGLRYFPFQAPILPNLDFFSSLLSRRHGNQKDSAR